MGKLSLLLNISKKSDLQVFIGSKKYPGRASDDYDYSVGDIDESDVERICTMYYMREFYQSATPFQYDLESDTVVY